MRLPACASSRKASRVGKQGALTSGTYHGEALTNHGRPRTFPGMAANLRDVDPEIADLIEKEERRERDVVRLIPSENYASHAVLAATGSVLNNKYSEGYPGKRYYEGQQFIDVIESLAIERAKALF